MNNSTAKKIRKALKQNGQDIKTPEGRRIYRRVKVLYTRASVGEKKHFLTPVVA